VTRFDGLPGQVQGPVESYLRALDESAPRLAEGVYVVGSVALGDYQPSISDVDLVTLCRDAPTSAELEALSGLHHASRPTVDTLYATRRDLGRDPSTLSLPGSVDGVFRDDGAFETNPVVWRMLATRAMRVRGAALDEGDVWFDADALRRWNLANLDSYWSEWIERARASDGTEAQVRHEYGLQWVVLGVPRLHFTIATLDVTSKTGGGRYALEVAPAQWHVVVETAIALRADRSAGLPVSPETLWHDAIDLSTWFIDDAHRLVDPR
jgi:nucleotidyltransferase-like protein